MTEPTDTGDPVYDRLVDAIYKAVALAGGLPQDDSGMVHAGQALRALNTVRNAVLGAASEYLTEAGHEAFVRSVLAAESASHEIIMKLVAQQRAQR